VSPAEFWKTILSLPSDELKDKIPKMVSVSLEFLNSLDPEAPLKFATSVALPIEQVYSW